MLTGVVQYDSSKNKLQRIHVDTEMIFLMRSFLRLKIMKYICQATMSIPNAKLQLDYSHIPQILN